MVKQMEIEKNVIDSLQDNTFFCVRSLGYSKENLLSVYKQYEEELDISNNIKIESILFRTGLITDKIGTLTYDIAFKLQMMELLFLVTFKKIIDCHNINQSDFDSVYNRVSQPFYESPNLSDKNDVALFIMVVYSVFLNEVIKKDFFKEAIINVHRFYISFKE